MISNHLYNQFRIGIGRTRWGLAPIEVFVKILSNAVGVQEEALVTVSNKNHIGELLTILFKLLEIEESLNDHAHLTSACLEVLIEFVFAKHFKRTAFFGLSVDKAITLVRVRNVYVLKVTLYASIIHERHLAFVGCVLDHVEEPAAHIVAIRC